MILSKVIQQSEQKYSYQDCWGYAFSLDKNIEIMQVKNDIIALCWTNTENFWLNFSCKILTTFDYSAICHNLGRYLKESYPIPYLTNKTSFFGLSFNVERGVFIPQKDTEILVEKTLEIASNHWKGDQRLKVLDIGTGCGNIVISLAKSRPNWRFTAIDINEKALEIAKTNALNYQIKIINFVQSDLFDEIQSKGKFDIIVCNPPYISDKEYKSVPFSTKFQPTEALIAKNDGYFFYQKIFREVSNFLTKKFLLIMEIGYQQEKGVIKLLIDYFPKMKVSIFPDYEDRLRVIMIYQ